MEIKAMSKSVQISPRKLRLVADAIRERSVKDAVMTLSLLHKRAGGALEKTIKSAVANAVHNGKLEADTLFVKSINITEGKSLKRFHPSTRGRVHPYKKRASHVYVVLTDNKLQMTNTKAQIKGKV